MKVGVDQGGASQVTLKMRNGQSLFRWKIEKEWGNEHLEMVDADKKDEHK